MTAKERLAKIDSLHERVLAKRAAILDKRNITGKDASRYVHLGQMLARIDVLMPFHRERVLPVGDGDA